MSVNNSDKLIDFVTGLVGEKFLKIDEDLGSGFFRLHLSEAERRQALQDIKNVEDCLIELLRNARDAGSKRIFVATSREKAGHRHLRVIDDGCGIPANMREIIFEPRVTSRLEKVVEDSYGIHGRGMALFSIKSSLAENKLAASATGFGSVFSLNADTSKLPERHDQSTFPKIKKEDGGLRFSGPHNIPRIMMEFAYYHQDISLFLGTPSEIISAMIHESNKTSSSELRDLNELPFWRRPARIAGAVDLSALAKDYFDIHISLRNAHRIICGEVKPARDLLESINYNKQSTIMSQQTDLLSAGADNRNFTKNISSQDREEFVQAIIGNFQQLGEKYFIKMRDKPKIRYGRKNIDICFSIEADQDSNV